MTGGISKRDAYQVLLMLRGIEGINIETDGSYYPMRENVSIEHILGQMGYEEKRETIKEEI